MFAERFVVMHDFHFAARLDHPAHGHLNGIRYLLELSTAKNAHLHFLSGDITAAFTAPARSAESFPDQQRLDAPLVNRAEGVAQAHHAAAAFSCARDSRLHQFHLPLELGLLPNVHRTFEHFSVAGCHAHREAAHNQALPGFRQLRSEWSQVILCAAEQDAAHIVLSKKAHRKICRILYIPFGHFFYIVGPTSYSATPAWRG